MQLLSKQGEVYQLYQIRLCETHFLGRLFRLENNSAHQCRHLPSNPACVSSKACDIHRHHSTASRFWRSSPVSGNLAKLWRGVWVRT